MAVAMPSIVCPPVEALQSDSQRDVPCPEPGCDRTFAQPSALRFHLVKVHKRVENDRDAAIHHRVSTVQHKQNSKEMRFHCPVASCKYHMQQGRHFSTMKYLKQHYMHVHAEKKFQCGRCERGFGQRSDQMRHERLCNVRFVCRACSHVFNSRQALLVHCRRNGHTSGFSSINSEVLGNAAENMTQESPLVSATSTSGEASLSSNTSSPSAIFPTSVSTCIAGTSPKTTTESSSLQVLKCKPALPPNTDNPTNGVKEVDSNKGMATQRRLLPRPDALCIPVEVKLDNTMSLVASQAGPLIFMVANCSSGIASKPKVIAPKPPSKSTAVGTGQPMQITLSGSERHTQDTQVQTEEQTVSYQPPFDKQCSAQTKAGKSKDPGTSAVATTQTSAQPSDEQVQRTKSSAQRRRQAEVGSQTRGGTLTKHSKRRRLAGRRQPTRDAGTQSEHSMLVDSIDISHVAKSPGIALQPSPLREKHPVDTTAQSAVTMPYMASLESINIDSASSPYVLNCPSELQSVSTAERKMLALNRRSTNSVAISTSTSDVGTSPSCQRVHDFVGSAVSMDGPLTNTIGTDPLCYSEQSPSITSASPSASQLALSSVFSQETQTSLWEELEASIAASNATQTMESYLATGSLGCGSNSPPALTVPELMESGVQTTAHAQHIQTQTWPGLTDSKSVGVGTSILDDDFFQGIETEEAISRSIGIDTQLFDDLFPEVSSRSVGISTPVCDSLEGRACTDSVESREQGSTQVDQRTAVVGSGAVHHFPDFNEWKTNDIGTGNHSNSSSVTCHSVSSGSQFDSSTTTSVQTDTRVYDVSSIGLQTSTEEAFSQLLTNMETQTSGDLFSDLSFVDIETQTQASGVPPGVGHVHTQTTQTPVASGMVSGGPVVSERDASLALATDMETQTLLSNLRLTEISLTDSHTQTTLKEVASLVRDLEESTSD